MHRVRRSQNWLKLKCPRAPPLCSGGKPYLNVNLKLFEPFIRVSKAASIFSIPSLYKMSSTRIWVFFVISLISLVSFSISESLLLKTLNVFWRSSWVFMSNWKKSKNQLFKSWILLIVYRFNVKNVLQANKSINKRISRKYIPT